jgi:hypothetical protein
MKVTVTFSIVEGINSWITAYPQDFTDEQLIRNLSDFTTTYLSQFSPKASVITKLLQEKVQYSLDEYLQFRSKMPTSLLLPLPQNPVLLSKFPAVK